MMSPENYNPHTEPVDTKDSVVSSESIPETLSPEDEKVRARRNFMKFLGGAAVGAVALGMASNVEARERKRRVPEIDRNERAQASTERNEQSEANVEYVGFRPNNHQAIIVKARLKQVVPDALSAEIFLERPKGSSLVTMRISVIKNDGSILETHARFNVSSRDVGRDADFTPALAHLFTRLQTEQEKGKK